MKIIIDGREFKKGITGIGRFTLNIINSLKLTRNDIKFTFVSNKQMYHVPDEIEQKVIPSSLPTFLFENVTLPNFINSLKGDLYFSPYYKCPPRLKLPSIITVHDINPYFYSGKLYGIYFGYILRQSLKRATVSLVVSNYVKEHVGKHFGHTKFKIVYNCVGPQFVPKRIPGDEKVLTALGISTDNYILYVGNNKPHKNIDRLIEAYKSIPKNTDTIPDLVLSSGGPSIEQMDNGGTIRRIDHVKEEDLPIYYRLAQFLVFPSLREGFGLPPLESMACGTPVISSNRTSLPEVIGDSGILINPESIHDIRDAMQRFIQNPQLREKYKKLGIKRAELFSMQNTGETYNRVIEDILRIK